MTYGPGEDDYLLEIVNKARPNVKFMFFFSQIRAVYWTEDVTLS